MSREGFPVSITGHETYGGVFTDLVGSSPPSPWGPFSNDYVTKFADKIGGNTPGWPKVKPKPVNYYLHQQVTRRIHSADLKFVQHFNGTGYNQGFAGEYPFSAMVGPFPETNDDVTNLIHSLTTRVNEKLRNKMKDQKVNGALFLAEFGKTASTVTTVARRLAQAIEQTWKGNVGAAMRTLGINTRDKRHALDGRSRFDSSRYMYHSQAIETAMERQALGSVARDWLSMQYGWKPLLSDVYGGCEELARVTTFQPAVCSVASKISAPLKGEWNYRAEPHFPKVRGTRDGRVSIKGFIEYVVSNQVVATASNTGISNPLSLAWELVPFSFVADWFLPVGNFLNNLDAANGLAFGRGYYNIKATDSWRLRGSSERTSTSDAQFNWSGGSWNYDAFYFERIPFAEFPPIEFPAFKDPTSLTRMASALALLHGVTRE
jgi:hypothetical protein